VRNTSARWRQNVSRRRAMAALAGFVGGSPIVRAAAGAQADPRPFAEHKRLPGIDEMSSAFDFEPIMFANVPQQVYDYTAHGDGSEFTLRRNRTAFEWVTLRPGRAVDPKTVDLSTTVLGTPMKYPILVAPSATQVPVHPEGEIGMYRAATAAANTPMILSYVSSISVDRVAPAATAPLWCQFYPQQDRNAGRAFLERVQTLGCRAVVVTVDQQASYYERTQHNRNLGGNPRPGFRGRGDGPVTGGPALYRASVNRLWYSWDYLDEVRKIVKVPLIVKGILAAEDAKLCVEHGMDGIIVSNHGGRSMDYGPSTLEVLPEIVAAVGGRIAIITDSGYRRGADILKGLALGADAVLLGRPTRWGLGAFGPPGAQRVLEIMQQELVDAAAAAGCATRAAIGSRLVTTNFS
jgi:isopentenyl diphosphate isomerase/L-lactate dehydrogenase-like FMN-dependent dehydrogenase